MTGGSQRSSSERSAGEFEAMRIDVAEHRAMRAEANKRQPTYNMDRRRADAELEDEIKFAYAEGTLITRRLADVVALIADQQRPVNDDDLSVIYGSLRNLQSRFFGILMIADPVGIDGVEEDVNRDTYSDGSMVSTLVHHPDALSPGNPNQRCYEGDIPYFPNISILPPEVDHLASHSDFPIVKWEAVVEPPPHDRRLNRLSDSGNSHDRIS